MRLEQRKKVTEIKNLEIIYTANSNRMTYWRKLHRAANILAQGYPTLILL
jgi:hypothetical protein